MARQIEFGIALSQCAARELVQQASLCEDLGFDHIWYGNEKFYPDMMIGLAVLAMHTSRVALGTFVADPYSIHPALTATAAATLDDVSSGRLILGIGAGGSRFREMGIQRKAPVTALEEMVCVIKGMLAGEKVTLDGKIVSLRDGFLSFPALREIPIIIGSRGDRVLELAGRVADGAMIATYATPEGITHGLNRIAQGARSAGRNLEDLSIYCRVDCCVMDDRGSARDAVKPMIALMLEGSYPDTGFVERMGLEIPPELLTIIQRQVDEEVEEAAHLVPEPFVDSYAWAGDAEEVANAITRAMLPGISGIVFLCHAPQGVDVVSVIRTLAEEVIPVVRDRLGYQPS